jgi:8-oxo-dGTP pyrophosphatase MutT (NUDIX family)
MIVESDTHKLSGVILIYNNKILLVRPRKFKRKHKKWSIPKGHIEGKMSKMKTALRELEEESRIKLKKKFLKEGEKYIIRYIKSNKNKVLTCYVVNIEKEQLNVKLFNDMILNEFLKGETVQAGFFSKEDAIQLIEPHQLDLLKFL